ncbi:hypothetical protein CKAH01_10749 [Colletotrichum kahawae]|uniref:MEI5 protein n=1 Tax=Colletotrichum kahawae TaxID=34407 RepID=A0AAD9XV73_COLKA|nr:hypothetical protein CKAH01_10749 [Colletotrichum kahawae]
MRLSADRDAEKEAFKKKAEEQNQEHNKIQKDKETAYQKLKAEQEITKELTEKIQSLEDEVQRSIAESKRQGDRATTLGNTNETLSKDLKEAKDIIAKLDAKLKAIKNEISIQSKDLTTAASKLAEIRSHTATLTVLDNVRTDIYNMLASSFKDALALFKEFLGHDIGRAQLQDTKSWDRVRDHAAIQRAIPIPASNSVNGKKMRAVAGLIICGRALAIHVFRPTYLSMGSDVEELLRALAMAKPSQEMFVRAVLHEVFPEQQRMRGDRCSELVVDEVFAAVADWVPIDQHATFRSRLSQLISLLRGSWQRVQRLDEKIEPCFVLKTPYDWQPLPKWIDAVAPVNYTRATTPGEGNKEHQTQQKDLKPVMLSTSEIVKIAWPAFLTTADDEAGASDPVCPGYVLTRAEVQGAEDEENSRRATRRAARNQNGGSQRNRRDSAVFLSQGSSNASEVR